MMKKSMQRYSLFIGLVGILAGISLLFYINIFPKPAPVVVAPLPPTTLTYNVGRAHPLPGTAAMLYENKALGLRFSYPKSYGEVVIENHSGRITAAFSPSGSTNDPQRAVFLMAQLLEPLEQQRDWGGLGWYISPEKPWTAPDDACYELAGLAANHPDWVKTLTDPLTCLDFHVGERRVAHLMPTPSSIYVVPVLKKLDDGVFIKTITLSDDNLIGMMGFERPADNLEKLVASLKFDLTTEPTPEVVSETDDSITLKFVGDIMLGRNVEQYIRTYGTAYPFAKAGNLLTDHDLLIGNFESTVREEENIEGTNVMSFDTTPVNVTMLAEQGFDLLSLSNNHADDFGKTVGQFTRDTITAAGITPFGDGWESEKFVAHKTVNGVPFAFIGYHTFNETTDGVVEAIKTEKAAGNFVVVMPHWGTEYVRDPSSSQVTAAHMFVDAGADVIIGAHPHVIQTTEIYKNVPIIYSLGNFLFDQDWSEATKRGMTVSLTITPDKLNLLFEPIYLEKRQMMPATEPKRQEMLETLGVPSGVIQITR